MGAPVAPVGRGTIDFATERPFRLGRASIDPLSREASFAECSERLQPQNLKVLIALARKRGKVVSRDELINLCWDGRFVSDDVINRSISLLRQFAERARGFTIETVPRVGYRLVEDRRLPKWRIGAAAAAAAAIALLVALAALIKLAPLPRGSLTPTIAVLPFTSASADPQERGLAARSRDTIARMLALTEYRIRLVDARPRSDGDIPDFIVSGDVAGAANKLSVTVRVEDTSNNAIVYSHQVETSRADAGNLPDEIGAQITGSIGWTAPLLMLEGRHPSDPAILAELFGYGGNFALARQIAARAPESAIAQAALAFAAAGQLPDLPRDQRAQAAQIGRGAMERVHALAPSSGVSDVLWCMLHSRARLVECEDHLRSGMARDPDSPLVETMLADRLKDVGRTDEALQHAQNSLGHDPFVAPKIGLTLRLLEATGPHPEAEQLYRDSKREWREHGVIFWDRVYGMLDRGDLEAVARFQDEAPPNLALNVQAALPVLTAIENKRLAQLKALCPPQQEPSYKRDICLIGLIRLGDNDDAFSLAERIYPRRIGRTPSEEEDLWLASPRYGDTDILMGAASAPLRRDRRFIELARNLGFLAYWQGGRRPDFCRGPRQEAVCSDLRAR